MARPNIFRFKLIHWYLIPLVSVTVWWGMLIAMLSAWSLQGHPIYWFMSTQQDPVYISDIGATNLKPLFISCAGFQAIFFLGTLFMEFLLRHLHKLQPYIDRKQYIFAIVSIACGVVGQAGIILTSIFDTHSYHRVHLSMVSIFILFVFFSCCFNFCVYFIFGRNPHKLHPHSEKVIFGPRRWQNVYMVNLLLKVIWLLTAAALAVCFGVYMYNGEHSISAIFEWCISFWYGVLLISWSIDLLPAAFHHYRKKHDASFEYGREKSPPSYHYPDQQNYQYPDEQPTSNFQGDEESSQFEYQLPTQPQPSYYEDDFASSTINTNPNTSHMALSEAGFPSPTVNRSSATSGGFKSFRMTMRG